MDAVSYPDTKVAAFINSSVIPLRVAFDNQPLATDFNIKWTPTLITLGMNGKEHHRTVGFLPPEDLIASLMLGMAKVDFDSERMDGALKMLEKLLQEYPKSDAAPEAMYLRGVCGYKSTHNPQPLRAAYDQLSAAYPASEWTKRAYPYRLL